MRLFVRDHLLLVIIQLVQLFLVLLVYWLDGYRNIPTAMYAVFIGLVILTGYLVYRYMSHRPFYRRLSEPLASMDESLQPTQLAQRTGIGAPLPIALDELLQSQYLHYHRLMKTWEKQRQEHVTYMNQWVHQMKTPLSVIHLTVQGDDDDPRLASIQEEAERIERGLETVLYVSRLEAFEHDFAVERVSIRRAVDRVIRENKRSFIRHRVYPEAHIEEEIKVETDAKWFHFVLNQLLSNAIKYSSGTQQKITFTASDEAGVVSLSIRDAGVGIPSHDLRRVWEPFYTGENGRHYRESTGMGLYLVREVCRRLGHRVELESKVGAGTTVTLIFDPRWRDPTLT